MTRRALSYLMAASIVIWATGLFTCAVIWRALEHSE